MASAEALIIQIRQARNSLRNNLPRRVAQEMLTETNQNFREQAYGNEGTPRRWRDRMGYVRGRGLVNAERYLRYPKLRYTGALQSSIRAASGPGFAELRSSSPYAQMHNEGKRGRAVGGGIWRNPPSSSVSIKLGTNPIQRQFMGVGKRTISNVQRLTNDIVKRL